MENRNTRIQGQGIKTLAAGVSVIVTNRDRNNVMTQFVVANLEPVGSTNNLYIASTDGKEALPVFPNSVITLLTDSPFKIIAATANTGAVSYTVGQLFLLAATSSSQLSAGGSASISGGNNNDFVQPGVKQLP
jgi:hypothetical protein